jgi:hypothetical protein
MPTPPVPPAKASPGRLSANEPCDKGTASAAPKRCQRETRALAPAPASRFRTQNKPLPISPGADSHNSRIDRTRQRISYLEGLSARHTCRLAADRRWCYSTPWEAPLASPTRALNSAVECHLHTVEVVGSNPTAPTNQTNNLASSRVAPHPLRPASITKAGAPCPDSGTWDTTNLARRVVFFPVMPHGLVRYHHTGNLHFITFSCFQRLPHLGSTAARDLFENALERTRRRYHFAVGGYVVMPEHIHLLMSEPAHGYSRGCDSRAQTVRYSAPQRTAFLAGSLL